MYKMTINDKTVTIEGQIQGKLNTLSGFTTQAAAFPYYNVDLIAATGSGSGGKADVVVSTGAVQSVKVTDAGSDYLSGNQVNIEAGYLGSHFGSVCGAQVSTAATSQSGLL